MREKLDTEALKLTVDERDIVWYLAGTGMPKSSNLDPTAFLSSDLWHDSEIIRISGTTHNAAIVHRLYEYKLNGSFRSLQICSPLCCESAEERKDPEVMLYKMRTFDVSPSLGGWHEFGIRDFPSYLLTEHFVNQDEPTDFSRRVLANHSAWPALSFIETIDVDATSKLLAQLIDPRWYIDANDPNRGSRLEQFLCLNPRGQIESRGMPGDWRNNKYGLVVSCWKNNAPPKVNIANPRNFIWRAWGSRGGGEKGELAASKLFISYLRLTWTQAMCDSAQASRLFVPKYFFQRDDETIAYIAWHNKVLGRA